MKQLTILIPFVLFIAQLVKAQEYTVDYTYEQSGNTRIIQNGKMGLIDKDKKIIIPAVYDKVNDFYYGFARVVKNDKVGFVDSKAIEVIPCIYEQDTQMITGVVMEHTIMADGQGESLDLSTNELRQGFNRDIVCVIKKGKYGFVNKLNKTVIPFQYDGADNFYGSIAIIKQKGKYGAINKTGKIIIPLIYDLLVWDFSSGSSFFAKKGSENFWVNEKGKKIRN